MIFSEILEQETVSKLSSEHLATSTAVLLNQALVVTEYMALLLNDQQLYTTNFNFYYHIDIISKPLKL